MFDDSIKANCFIPQNIDILFTNRSGGYSLPPYDSFNLATHVGDNLNVVERNRGLLIEKLPNQPIWLNQIHGSQVFDADVWNGNLIPTADAAVTTKKNRVLAILTADCLPILLSTTDGSVIGAVHAGWRGLASGVIEKTVELMREKIIIQDSQQKIRAYFGVAIGPRSFEVGEDVVSVFVDYDPRALKSFAPSKQAGKYLADIYGLAKDRLHAVGINDIDGGDNCTYENMNFFSYRRDRITGRMASFIWIKNIIS
jgi:YfiH family protein